MNALLVKDRDGAITTNMFSIVIHTTLSVTLILIYIQLYYNNVEMGVPCTL